MGVTFRYFNIEFDRDLFYPGQMVSGRVLLALDKPKELNGVELKLSGKARCSWKTNESYTDSEGKTHWRDVWHTGKESYLSSKINLTGGKSKFELPIGEYVYPFSVLLPSSVPSSYSGTHGGISYCGKAKLDIPWAPDKSEKKYFTVQNLINLKNMPELNNPFKNEKSKTFCCWCCASAPLTVVVHVPRTGFAYTEAIPITIEVDNASNVKVCKVQAEVNQRITWKTSDDTKHEKNNMKKLNFGEVEEGGSETWSELLELGPNRYPNTGNCGVIKISYELEIELDVGELHSNVEIKTPITIGDVAYDGESPAYDGNLAPQPAQPGFAHPTGFNPLPLGDPTPGMGFAPPAGYLGPAYPVPPPNAAVPYPSPVAPGPYPPATNPAQMPGMQPYSGAPPQPPSSVPAGYPAAQPPMAPSGYPLPQPAVAPDYNLPPQSAAQFTYPPASTAIAETSTPSAPAELDMSKDSFYGPSVVDMPKSDFLNH